MGKRPRRRSEGPQRKKSKAAIKKARALTATRGKQLALPPFFEPMEPVRMHDNAWRMKREITHGYATAEARIYHRGIARYNPNVRRGTDTIFVRSVINFYGRNNCTAIATTSPLLSYIPEAAWQRGYAGSLSARR